jgi:hypothetical protein
MNGNNIRCLFFGGGVVGDSLANHLFHHLTYRDYVYLARGVGRMENDNIEIMLKESYNED